MRRSVVPALLLCLISIPSTTFAASLFISPPNGTYSVGDQVRMKVSVSSSELPLNAISGTLSLPSSLFAIQSISKTDSILNFWVAEPTFSANSGTVQFEGVSLSGFQGNSGAVVTVVLRALKVGSGTISFQSGQVLANDGQGTDITSGLTGASFQIQAAKAKPTPVPPQEEIQPEIPTVPSRLAPIISLGEKGETPTIIGTSVYKNADVLLTFVPVAGTKLYITGVTGDDGNFVFAVPLALRNGPYAVSAVVVLKDGSHSDSSNTLTIEVGGAFVPYVNWENATYLSLFISIVLLTFFLYVLSLKHFTRRTALPGALKKEVKQAEDALHKSFKVLDQDLTEHAKIAAASGKVASEEREHIAGLRKDLRDAEDYIDKEIKDIGATDFNEKE